MSASPVQQRNHFQEILKQVQNDVIFLTAEERGIFAVYTELLCVFLWPFSVVKFVFVGDPEINSGLWETNT